MKWNAYPQKKPFKDGRYWVYPYRTVDGHLMVTMASYQNNQWDTHGRPQDYMWWRPLEIPRPPKAKLDYEGES